jgi:hypothetical protein
MCVRACLACAPLSCISSLFALYIAYVFCLLCPSVVVSLLFELFASCVFLVPSKPMC